MPISNERIEELTEKYLERAREQSLFLPEDLNEMGYWIIVPAEQGLDAMVVGEYMMAVRMAVVHPDFYVLGERFKSEEERDPSLSKNGVVMKKAHLAN